MVIRATGLTKIYRGVDGAAPVRVLDGVDLEARPGQVVAVIGESGSSKSTLLNLLGLLEPADGGEIWFDDERVSHLSRRAQCRVRGTRIGYVFQAFLLIGSLTALDNVLTDCRNFPGPLWVLGNNFVRAAISSRRSSQAPVVSA